MANCKTCLHAAVCGKRIATGGHVKECKNFMEKKQGRWVEEISPLGLFRLPKCSQCNLKNDRESPYCPNCGADMRGEKDA